MDKVVNHWVRRTECLSAVAVEAIRTRRKISDAIFGIK